MRFSIAFLISWLWQINNRWRLSEQEKTTAELAFLRAQINPHFLFNTLNSIYALALTRSEQTPAAVAKLSAMMRYVTNEANRDTVGLDKELDYIRNYIDLQKIRFGDTIRLSYTESGEAAGRRIAPLLLIPFVENAFKYGISPEEDSEIRISACCTVDQFELRVSNNKVRIQAGKELSNGVGLHNTHNRLEHLYPGRYRMQVENLPERYSVFLQLDLS